MLRLSNKIITLIKASRKAKVSDLTEEAIKFTEIYNNHSWAGGEETRSGSGSTLNSTQNTVPLLQNFISNYRIRTLVDVGCGDGLWILKIIPLLRRYQGHDIVAELIEKNKIRAKERGLRGVSYSVLNPVHEIPEKADAILFRDVAIHLPNELIIKSFSNFVASGSKYLITTNFPNEPETSKFYERLNGPVRIGKYRRVDYSKEPFLLPDPIFRIQDNEINPDGLMAGKHKNRELAVYRLDQIKDRVKELLDSLDG